LFVSVEINAEEALLSSNKKFKDGTWATVLFRKSGYFPVPPVLILITTSRAAMCGAMETMGLVIEVYHHEVATAGQNENSVFKF